MGSIEVLIALLVLAIVVAGVFLLRPSITAGVTGKMLAFVGLCVLPALSLGTGMSFHLERSQETRYCISCHSMESHGKSLYVLSTNYIPAQHFQNHLVPHDHACYACHTDYTMYGPLKDKIKGLRYLYLEYVTAPPKSIHLSGTYKNVQCLHCHESMRRFDEKPSHTAIMGSLRSNRISCISCHNAIHSASEVDGLPKWVEGDAPTSVTAGAAPATMEPAATAGAASGPSVRASGDPADVRGKSIFEAQGCRGCHGANGVGGTGPALTHTSGQYPAAQLTAVLKAPSAKLKAAGMVPVTLNAADMKALVSYVRGLGATSSRSATASRSTVPVGAPVPGPAQTSSQPQPTSTSPGVPPAAPGGAVAQGRALFESRRCSSCHGAGGVGGSGGQALTEVSAKLQPSQLTALLREPNAAMKAGGMVPLTLSSTEMTALVSYMSSLSGTPVASATTAAPAPAQPAPQPQASVANSAATRQAATASGQGGEAIYSAQGCAACHGPGGSGTARGPALTKRGNTNTPEALTGLLQTPTPTMRAAGMTPTKLTATDMSALVAYVQSLGSAGAVTGAAPAQYSGNADAVKVLTAGYPAAIQKDYRVFSLKCNQCHGLDESMGAGVSADRAVAEVNQMQAMASSQITDAEARAIVEFLNYNREHGKPPK